MISAKTGLGDDRLLSLLLQSGVATQLKMWRLQAIEAGQLETARNHEQTWDALMSLLDEYVTVYGESSFDFTTFQEIFVSGLEGLHYSKVPTAIDQVQVRAMDLTRPGAPRLLLLLG